MKWLVISSVVAIAATCAFIVYTMSPTDTQHEIDADLRSVSSACHTLFTRCVGVVRDMCAPADGPPDPTRSHPPPVTAAPTATNGCSREGGVAVLVGRDDTVVDQDEGHPTAEEAADLGASLLRDIAAGTTGILLPSNHTGGIQGRMASVSAARDVVLSDSARMEAEILRTLPSQAYMGSAASGTMIKLEDDGRPALLG